MTELPSRLNAALEGRYRIERELGAGGMATVYLADDLKHDRKVAIKVLKPELAAVIGAERFLAEIKTTANLHHPHILPLFDSGEADGFLYYVMPYIGGETLRDRIEREGQLGVEEAVRIARDVADALDYAHRSDVIHRDIKPANILLHDGRPVVADFGIALAISAAGGGRMTETGLSLGTPHYMSPEQASADRGLSARSDVYSLGCVLYEMLAGQPPHTGPSAQSVLVRILTEEARDVRELRRTVPSHVGAVVMKSIEKLPADRFDGARPFMEALGDESFQYTPLTRPATGSPPPPEAGAPTPNRGPLLAVGAAAVLALAVAVWGWMSPAPPEAPAARARIDLEGFQVHGLGKVVISPDGRRLAAVSSDGLWVRNLEDERFRRLLDEGSPRGATFSPQGDWVLYSDGGALLRVSLEGGAPRPVVPASAGLQPFQPHWGDRGTIVFESHDRLYRVPETGGEPTVVVEGLGEITNPRLLPGESGVLFSVAVAFNTYYADLETGEAQEIISGGIAPIYVDTGHILYVDPQGGLWAVPFDADRGRVTGEATPVLDGIPVRFDRFVRFDVSKNGTLVYGLGGAGAVALPMELIEVGLDGRERVLPLAPRTIDEPRWAPDGRRIAYSGSETADPSQASSANIYVYDVELGTAPRPVVATGSNYEPVWSPDGSRIVFREEGDLAVTVVDDDAPPQPILSLEGRDSPTSWLEDGTIVFVNRLSGTDADIWTVQEGDSTTARPYLPSENLTYRSSVSPEGDLLAYESNEVGGIRVYVRSFPTPRQASPVSLGEGLYPRWAPDGRTLYYWSSGLGGVDTLHAASVQRDPTFAVLSRQVVLVGSYGFRNWDLHPDGERFISARPVATETADAEHDPDRQERHLIVANWFTELRAALGAGN